MTFTDGHIDDTYLESLSTGGKLELIEKLVKLLKAGKKKTEKKEDSIEKERKKRHKALSNAFGSYVSEKSAEDIIAELKAARSFKRKEIKL